MKHYVYFTDKKNKARRLKCEGEGEGSSALQGAPSQSRQETNSRAPAWRPERPLAARHAICGREVMAGKKKNFLRFGFCFRVDGRGFIHRVRDFIDCLGFKRDVLRVWGRKEGSERLLMSEGEEFPGARRTGSAERRSPLKGDSPDLWCRPRELPVRGQAPWEVHTAQLPPP